MREAWARRLALISTVLVLAGAALFALALNPSEPAQAEAGAPVAVPEADPAVLARGQAVYQEQDCESCHSVAGRGNPRNPLDGIGLRLSPEAILHWTVAAPEVADQLPARIRNLKQSYSEVDQEDLDALVAWLAQLPAG